MFAGSTVSVKPGWHCTCAFQYSISQEGSAHSAVLLSQLGLWLWIELWLQIDSGERPLIFVDREFIPLLLGDDSILLGLWPLKKEFCLLAKPLSLRPSQASRQSTKKDSFSPTSEMEVSLLSIFALFTSALSRTGSLSINVFTHLERVQKKVVLPPRAEIAGLIP